MAGVWFCFLYKVCEVKIPSGYKGKNGTSFLNTVEVLFNGRYFPDVNSRRIIAVVSAKFSAILFAIQEAVFVVCFWRNVLM